MSIKKIATWSILGILAMWIGFWILVWNGFASYPERGQFGDMFGAINALFTGLAFAGVIITVILQSQELSLQRQELRETRKEFRQQNLTLKYQRFENTFFNLIDQYRSLGKTAFPGRVIGMFNEQMFREPLQFSEMQYAYNYNSRTSHDGKTNVSLSYEIQDEFGAHLRTFQSIVEFIYSKKKKVQNRKRYLRFFFAQLSNFELILFFYHFNLRHESPPHAFREYDKELFNSLHTSPIMPTTHYMTIVNKDVDQKK